MEKYLEDFICNLQEAAEAAGKDFDPAAHTELEIRQLWELYTEISIHAPREGSDVESC